MRKNQIFFISCFLFFLSLFYRLGNLQTPFWIDEFCSANQAQLFLKHGFNVLFQQSDFIEQNNFFTHFIISLSFHFGEITENFARLPFVIFGSFVPVLMFLFVLKTFGTLPAFCSSLLLTFSYWEITWSRQARGYVLQQFLILLTLLIYNYFFLAKTNKKKIFFGLTLLLSIFFGLLTHKLFVFVAFSLFIHFAIFKFNELKVICKKYWWIFLLFAFVLIFFEMRMNTLAGVLRGFKTGFLSFYNNTWYYQRFLWKHYSLFVFLAFIGLAFAWRKNKSITVLIALICGFIFSFINFFFFYFASKYLLPIFPFLILLSSLVIVEIAKLVARLFKVEKKNQNLLIFLISFCLTLFIIINGDQFSLKKKIFYSVNYNFREFALIDYDEVYSLIKNKIDQTSDEVAMIDTWTNRSRWYLGLDYFPLNIFKSIDRNNPHRNPYYQLNKEGEKTIIRKKNYKIDDERNYILVSDLNDFKKVMSKYNKGFLLVDDDVMSREVITYAQNNLKLELFTDHFELDENPYSKWPLYLYSWGFND
jgi:hypothetical protein